jgi:hypothetical protein
MFASVLPIPSSFAACGVAGSATRTSASGSSRSGLEPGHHVDSDRAGSVGSVDASAKLVALLASIAVGVACGGVITLWWKFSVHAAITVGAATVLLVVLGPALLAAWALVAVIAWSRVQVGDHTPAQVLAGVTWGIVVNAAILPLLRLRVSGSVAAASLPTISRPAFVAVAISQEYPAVPFGLSGQARGKLAPGPDGS